MVKYLVALFVLFVLTIVAQAQSGQPKSEIGGHVSISRQYQLYSGTSFDSTGTQIGVGARYTFNFTPALAAEGEVTMYPQKQRQKLFGLFGIKAGKRTERVGYFFKLRPGFFNHEDPISCVAAT